MKTRISTSATTSNARVDGSRTVGRGFTAFELLVVLAVGGFLILVAAPALSRTKPGTRSSQCLANIRAMISGWQMYAQDYSDQMVVTLQGGATLGGVGDPSLGVGWVSGWLDFTTARDNTNVLLLVDPRYAKLAKYVKDARTYKCPSDNYVSPAQVASHWTQRSRSYSGNIYVGPSNAESGVTDPIYKHIRRTSEFLYPSPAEAWVFGEEHPDSLNDPCLYPPHQTSWVDVPSVFHNGAGTFAFADGHGEIHKWEASLTQGRAPQIRLSVSGIGIPAPVRDADIHWMRYHSVRVTTNSY